MRPLLGLAPLLTQLPLQDIRAVLNQPGYDDGSAGPIFVRLAWHASGTYSLVEHTGGSNGAGACLFMTSTALSRYILIETSSILCRHEVRQGGRRPGQCVSLSLSLAFSPPADLLFSLLDAGLYHAINFLLPIQAKHPWISHADLWTLAGVTAVEAMGGPKTPWTPGRTDYVRGCHCRSHRPCWHLALTAALLTTGG